MKPRPYQLEIARHQIEVPRSATFVSMGAGKSCATLIAEDILRLQGEVQRTLVIGPLRVARSVWPEECRKWTPHLSCKFIGGEGAGKRNLLNSGADIDTINFDQLTHLILQAGKHWPYQRIIVDEASFLRGFRLNQGTKRTHALATVAFRSKYFSGLTGTPTPNGVQNLWGILWFLDGGVRLGRTFTAFTDRWFYPNPNGHGVLPHTSAVPQIHAAVKDLAISIDLSKHLDLGAVVLNDIKVELPPKAREQYKAMERAFFTELGTGEIEAFNAASKSNKMLQILNGSVLDVDGTSHWVHDAKLDALEEVVSEAEGAPIMVVYQYVADKERILQKFKQARELKTDKDILDFNFGKIPMLLLHPASGGHGISLHHSCNIGVLFGVTWDLNLYLQVCERIGPARQAQSGYKRPVFLHRIIASDTLDEDVLTRLDGKATVQQALLNAVRRR